MLLHCNLNLKYYPQTPPRAKLYEHDICKGDGDGDGDGDVTSMTYVKVMVMRIMGVFLVI